MSNIHKIQEIMGLGVLITRSGTKQVFVEYSGHCDLLDVRIYPAGTNWSMEAAVPASEFSATVHLAWQDDVCKRLDKIRAELENLMTEAVA